MHPLALLAAFIGVFLISGQAAGIGVHALGLFCAIVSAFANLRLFRTAFGCLIVSCYSTRNDAAFTGSRRSIDCRGAQCMGKLQRKQNVVKNKTERHINIVSS